MFKNKPEWLQAVVGVVVLIATSFSIYGGYSADLAVRDAKVDYLDKVFAKNTKDIYGISQEVDVLWVDTQKNSESISQLRKNQDKFDATFIKFTDAVNRLSISVAKLEERLGMLKEKGE